MKIRNTTERDETIRGVDLPAGKAVDVENEATAQKVLGIPGFVEVKARKNAKKSD